VDTEGNPIADIRGDMRSSFRRRWLNNVSYEGGLSLIWMDGLLLVPFVMAAFFYPLEALLGAAALLIVTFAVYESCVIWRRRHPQPPETQVRPADSTT
jgi:hypothetical protein